VTEFLQCKCRFVKVEVDVWLVFDVGKFPVNILISLVSFLRIPYLFATFPVNIKSLWFLSGEYLISSLNFSLKVIYLWLLSCEYLISLLPSL
jgi:hypothetical protein